MDHGYWMDVSGMSIQRRKNDKAEFDKGPVLHQDTPFKDNRMFHQRPLLDQDRLTMHEELARLNKAIEDAVGEMQIMCDCGNDCSVITAIDILRKHPRTKEDNNEHQIIYLDWVCYWRIRHINYYDA